jgi:hypothetical protein
MTLRSRFAALSRRQRLAVYFGVAISLYAAAGFLLVPYLIRTQLPPRLSETLGRSVSIDKVSWPAPRGATRLVPRDPPARLAIETLDRRL